MFSARSASGSPGPSTHHEAKRSGKGATSRSTLTSSPMFLYTFSILYSTTSTGKVV